MDITHEPPGYQCPFCVLIAGGDTGLTGQADVLRRTEGATAIMSPHWWPRNPGHALVVPNEHHENLYALPAEAGYAVMNLVREVAVAMREVLDGCQGVTTRQNNEPAGNQDVWHLHTHVVPRYPGDRLYREGRIALVATEARLAYARRLRAALKG
ncbi:hypothetical protein Afil01_29810 [Actinorhabdospora filicis]|uniref:HIT domain-containing protein n=1 Tax=Actinorhabdospora filicis TaxID=1785913 RepID=A0A9W6SLX0_9ACTN|nr:HIT family protein [Actinorhabdospora filicis]GLZ78174.1 hypothetical protein Afil01_29810 [Actinorhabdospora filicis]